MKRKRLAIVSTHPIQYHSAWFRALASNSQVELEVLFCHQPTAREHAESGFEVEFEWDSKLLEGYQYRFLNNTASRPSVHGFHGTDTPEIKTLVSDYDAVIVNGWHYKSAWQTIHCCWQARKPVMVKGDSHLHDPRPLTTRILKWPFYRWFIPRLDACLAAGSWSRDYYLHYGAKPDRIFFVPHAVDPELFSASANSTSSMHTGLRGEFQLDSSRTAFLYVGKFTRGKRPMDFVRGIDMTARSGAPVMGLMVGDGPMKPVCEAYARENGIPIRFTGFINQSRMAAAYLAADALVVPSAAETWGVTVSEAMACGRPCIVSDRVGSGPDLVEPGKTGASYPVGDIDTLSSLLAAFAQEPLKLRQMGESARLKIDGYSVPAAVDGVMEALKNVL